MAAFLLAACTSGGGGDKAAGFSASPTPSVSRTADEKQLTEQAQSVVASVRSGTMFAAGAERVTDGVHTETTVTRGKTYRLSVVCFGNGSARLGFTPARYGARSAVPCDQSMVQRRITGRSGAVRIDIDGAEGATGVIAWEIDEIDAI
jgi:hypothetical protein